MVAADDCCLLDTTQTYCEEFKDLRPDTSCENFTEAALGIYFKFTKIKLKLLHMIYRVLMQHCMSAVVYN